VTTVLVVDASAIAEMLLGTAKGRRVAEAVGSEHSLHAPELLSLEIASVLRGLVRTGQIDVTDAGQVIADLSSLGIEFYEHLAFLPRVFAMRDNLTAHAEKSRWGGLAKARTDRDFSRFPQLRTRNPLIA